MLDQEAELPSHPQKQSLFQRVLYFWQFLQIGLVALYCSLSVSVPSTLSLLLALLALTFTVCKVYVFREKERTLLRGSAMTPESLNLERLIWTIFAAENVFFLIFKIIYFSGNWIELSNKAKDALEVTSTLRAFLPVILLGTSLPLLKLISQKPSAEHFSQPLSPIIALLTYSALLASLLLVQVFNVSFLALLLVPLQLALLLQPKWNFLSGHILVQAVWFVCSSALIMSMVAAVAGFSQQNADYWGIGTMLRDYWAEAVGQLFMASLVSSILLSLLIWRLFTYEKMRLFYLERDRKLAAEEMVQGEPPRPKTTEKVVVRRLSQLEMQVLSHDHFAVFED